MPSERVLVLGDDTRAFLSAVRSLGRHGLAVHVAPGDHTSPALSSRYVAAVHRLPPYNLDSAAWVAAVRELADRHGFALVVPCDDRAILPLHRHAAALPGVRVALPNEQALRVFFDKWETRRVAVAAGVPVAAGEAVDSDSDAAALVARYGLPLALKPRTSFELRQIASRRVVQIIATETALSAALAGLHGDPAGWFVEGFFRGAGVGVSVLAAEGRIVQAFQHLRVNEATAGGSTYRVSVPLDPALLANAEALAAATGLHGVAMCEFRQDASSGSAILLEVNARFWGSLPLAIAAGVDFPALLYELLVHGRTTPRIAYRVGQYARSLEVDAYRLARDLGDGTRPMPARLRAVAGELGVSLARAVRGRERHDSFAGDDLRPWFGEWRRIAGWVGTGLRRRLPLLRHTPGTARPRALARQLAPQAGAEPRRLLVLCYGNICRSPFAVELLRRRLADTRPDILVAGAGFLDREDRPSPPEAVAAAAALGVDLGAHRSRFARDAAVMAADAILVFDAGHVAELERRGLRRTGVFLLGDFGPEPADIEDPYGQPAAVFAATYRRITAAVDGLLERLDTPLPHRRNGVVRSPTEATPAVVPRAELEDRP